MVAISGIETVKSPFKGFSFALRKHVLISNRGIEKALSKKYKSQEKRRKMIPKLPEIVREAHLIAKEENYKKEDRKQLLNVYSLASVVFLDSQLESVWIKIGHYQNGDFVLIDFGLNE